MVSFESMANSTKFRNCYIAVKSNGTPGNTRATGFLSDDILFQVRIAQLVSTIRAISCNIVHSCAAEVL